MSIFRNFFSLFLRRLDGGCYGGLILPLFGVYVRHNWYDFGLARKVTDVGLNFWPNLPPKEGGFLFRYSWRWEL